MPVELTIHFADGSHGRVFWEGRERWREFTVQGGKEIAWAEVTARPLDINHVDNSYSPRPDWRAGVKLAALWSFVLQHLMELIAWML